MPIPDILQIHNRYIDPGGEDSVVESEGALLRSRGHEVREYFDDNHRIAAMSKATLAGNLFWSRTSAQEVGTMFAGRRSSIAHIHNLYYLISPSVYQACNDNRIPIVQTLHNYRFGCVSARLYRDGKPCTDCVGGSFRWKGIRHACFQDSFVRSTVLTAAVDLHRSLNVFGRVDMFVALSQCARKWHIASGVPADKIVVKPNFVFPDPGAGQGDGGFCIFVGRLERDKGLDVLLQAARLLAGRFPIKIVGHGSLAGYVRRMSLEIPGVEYLGPRTRPEVLALMQRAICVLFPNQMFENFPVVLAEALATGVPVVASDLGSSKEIIEPGRTGVLFQPASAEDFASKIEWLLTDTGRLNRMRREARAEYQAKYTAERNYAQLLQIYELAAEHARRN